MLISTNDQLLDLLFFPGFLHLKTPWSSIGEFGDGSMHNSKSQNYAKGQPFPLWLKLVRHGDRLSGYYSFDGRVWILSRESEPITSIAPVLDIGLAAGSNNQNSSMMKFEEFKIWVEN